MHWNTDSRRGSDFLGIVSGNLAKNDTFRGEINSLNCRPPVTPTLAAITTPTSRPPSTASFSQTAQSKTAVSARIAFQASQDVTWMMATIHKVG